MVKPPPTSNKELPVSTTVQTNRPIRRLGRTILVPLSKLSFSARVFLGLLGFSIMLVSASPYINESYGRQQTGWVVSVTPVPLAAQQPHPGSNITITNLPELYEVELALDGGPTVKVTTTTKVEAHKPISYWSRPNGDQLIVSLSTLPTQYPLRSWWWWLPAGLGLGLLLFALFQPHLAVRLNQPKRTPAASPAPTTSSTPITSTMCAHGDDYKNEHAESI